MWFHDRTTARAFVVEHDVDKALLKRFVRRLFTTHGSGPDTEGFTHRRKTPGKVIQIGYLSRFDKVRRPEILKAAQNLPSDRRLIIAGWDIKGERYSKKFAELAQEKAMLRFWAGFIRAPKSANSSITRLISPHGEGGNIALRSNLARIPFLTTDAPGCQVLADRFGCQAVKMNEFEKRCYHCCINTQIKTNDWCEKIKPFSVPNVSKEYEFILKQVLNAQESAR